MSIELRCTVRRGDFTLSLDLGLPGQGVTALFGPSGAGKTSCLRVLAGLERHDDATVVVNGHTWQSRDGFLAPHRRALGYVFQEASLFPHLSVRGNLDYGFRRAGRPARIDRGALIDLLGLAPLLNRRPDTLSGGERQRVAIARALFTAPMLLLLDEPLAALDANRKTEILPYLERLLTQLEIPALYVSHAPDEVLRLADHLVLLDRGGVTAQGPLADTLTRLDLPLGLGLEPSFILQATVAEHERDRITRLQFGSGGTLWITGHQASPGTPVRCRVLARDVSLTLSEARDSSILNRLPATVVDWRSQSETGRCSVRLRVADTLVLADISERSRRHLDLAPGQMLWAQVKSLALLS